MCCVNTLLMLWKDASRPLEVVSAADSRFSSRVELSVRFGKTLLILECDGVEPMLYPLARQDLVHQGPRHVVQVGDKVRNISMGGGLDMEKIVTVAAGMGLWGW